jgi:uncharacterized membrane protein YczE
MKTTERYSPMFKLACETVKYFFLSLFSFSILCIVLAGLGASALVSVLLAVVGGWFLRVGAIALCFMASAIIFESLRF